MRSLSICFIEKYGEMWKSFPELSPLEHCGGLQYLSTIMICDRWVCPNMGIREVNVQKCWGNMIIKAH